MKMDHIHLQNKYLKNFEKYWLDKQIRPLIVILSFEVFSDILSSEKLIVQNEFIIWQVIHDWVSSDKSKRLEHLSELIKNCLPFDRLPEKFINACIFNCELFMTLPDKIQQGVKTFVENVYQSKQIKKMPNDFNLSNLPSVDNHLICIDMVLGDVTFYNNQYNCWQSSPLFLKLPTGQTNYQLEIFDSILHAFGGENNESNSTNKAWSCYLSEPSSQWTTMAPMNQGRSYFSSVFFEKIIYVLSGWCKGKVVNSCERYDGQQNVWSIIAPMKTARFHASATVYKGCIYIAGGQNKDYKIEQSVEKYDPRFNKWIMVAPMITPRWGFALTPFAGRLWSIGGLDGKQSLSTVESYDPISNTWREEPAMNEARCNHSAIEYNGQLYVVGGSKIKTEKFVFGKGWIENGELHKQAENSKLFIVPENNSKSFINFNTS